MLTRNQNLVSGRSSIPSLKHGINLAAITPPNKGRSGDNFVSSLNSTPPPPPASDVASSSHPYPPDLLGSTIPDSSVGDVTSSGHHGSIDENDIVIAVMGPTGAGKSSLVNKAAGKLEVMIGYDLTSKTRGVQPVRCPHPDGRRNIVLVDTPGFDDTHLSDSQILKIIANWLKKTYQNNIKLAGILYLHRISDVRMAGTPLRNLSVFQDLCGDSNLKNVVLVTTMWDEVEDEPVGSKREEELLSTFWNVMIGHGSRAHRFQGTRESAWEIINLLDLEGSHQRRTPLEIQQEMVDRGLQFNETTAAKTLLRSLVRMAGEFKKVWVKMRNGASRTPGPRKRYGGILRRTVLSRSSTISSTFSTTSWSAVSSTDSSSIASDDSRFPPSPTETTASRCSAIGRRDALVVMITGLRFAHQVADMVPVPMLRGAIGTVLQIAQRIEGMGGTHHAISQVIENSGWLLDEIARYAAESKLTRDMKKTLSSFQKELNGLQKVVEKISNRGPITRFVLHDADIQAITGCTASIRTISDKLGVKLAIDNRQAISRLEDQLMELRKSTESRKCECGNSVVYEE